MKAYVFPGQGAQFSGMGKDLYDQFDWAKELFAEADSILGFKISDIMFSGSDEDLRRTDITQPAVFIHSVAVAKSHGADFKPDMVAGHSLGEFSALVACGALSFESGLKLVSKRAGAMQKCCEKVPGTMAAIIGLPDARIEEICAGLNAKGLVVVPANYNSPGQVVISGSKEAIEAACPLMTEAGAKRALPLTVGGAFHSPLMTPAKDERACCCDCLLGTRNNHLTGAVVVGRNNHHAFLVQAGADLLDLGIGQTYDGSHCAGNLLAALLHGVGTL